MTHIYLVYIYLAYGFTHSDIYQSHQYKIVSVADYSVFSICEAGYYDWFCQLKLKG